MTRRISFLATFLILASCLAYADRFQDSQGVVFIQSDTAQFRCSSSDFLSYELNYEAPPAGATRLWTDTYHCLQQDGVQFEDSFYSAERFTYIVSHIVDYIEASTDVVIDGDGLLTAFTGDYITTDMQMLLDGTDTGTLWHDSGEPWYIEDVGGGYTCKGHTFRLRVVSEFNTTEMYLTWLDDQREQAIKSIPWKGVITLNASGEFTWAHNLGFTQYIVLLTPFQQSMPNLYVTATANAIVVSGGVASGKVIYKIELNLR